MPKVGGPGRAWISAIASLIEDGLIVADASGEVLVCNPAAERLLGKAPDRGPIDRALRGEDVDSHGANGEVIARPIREDGAIVGAVVVARAADATDAARKRTAAFLDSIVENIPTTIFVKDARDLHYELFNRACEEMLGVPREKLLGKTDYDIFPAEQAAFFQQRDRETIAQRTLVDIPEEPIRTERGERWLQTKKIPIYDEAGEPKYLLGISLDITERKLAQEALRKANDELARRMAEGTEALRKSEELLRQSQKMEAIGRLAGGVAHDFNNMLSVILTCVDFVASQVAPGAARESVQEIGLAATRAATLTRKLLAFGRQQVLLPKVQSLNAVVADMIPMMQRLVGETIAIASDLAPDLDDARIDRGQMEQVIVNLIVNARDAMPSGGAVRIATRNASHADGRRVVLTVSDTGVGMDAQTQSRIFEPFFTTKARGQGTGLGLAMAYGIVAQTGGDLAVTSAPGRGATFTITMPASGRRAATESPARADPSGLAMGHESILLVEDEDLVRGAARRALERAGYRVREAASADAALSLVREGIAVDLVVTDVVMPRMSGPELVKELRALRPGVRVLYVSGFVDGAVSAFGDPTIFLAKPFTAQSLTHKVRDVLDVASPPRLSLVPQPRG